MRYWLTSDIHLGHTNILKYSRRPFSTIEEHDRTLIENWNACVGKGDTVFFLGDFSYRSKGEAIKYRAKLNGQIFFIEGNHDAAAESIKETFAWYGSVYQRKIKRENGDISLFLSHYAHRVWDASHHGVWHLYGHSHGSLPDLPDSLSFDVGVDAVALRAVGHKLGGDIPEGITHPQDYRPINLEEIGEVMAKKTFKPIDHHGKDRT